MLFLQGVFCKRFQKWPFLPADLHVCRVAAAKLRRRRMRTIFLDTMRFVGAVSARTRMKAVSETDYTVPDTRAGVGGRQRQREI
jgi:hypothetical protein